VGLSSELLGTVILREVGGFCRTAVVVPPDERGVVHAVVRLLPSRPEHEQALTQAAAGDGQISPEHLSMSPGWLNAWRTPL
jgi:hypothetical protein